MFLLIHALRISSIYGSSVQEFGMNELNCFWLGTWMSFPLYLRYSYAFYMIDCSRPAVPGDARMMPIREFDLMMYKMDRIYIYHATKQNNNGI